MATSDHFPTKVGLRRVLIVEDEFLIADDLRRLLSQAGYVVVGPTASLDAAAREIERRRVDIALLDINIDGALSFGLAIKLQTLAIPFLFLTGYEAHSLPPRFAAVTCLMKPCDQALVLDGIRRGLAL